MRDAANASHKRAIGLLGRQVSQALEFNETEGQRDELAIGSGISTARERRHATEAKRGMFALVERRHSYMSLKDGHHAWHTYTPCIVSSVARDGLAKEVRLAGQSWPLKAQDWTRLVLDGAGRIASPETVAASLVDERGMAIEYKDRDEAVAAIRAAAGVAQ